MRFIMYGAGAIGGTIGARLAQAGHDVLLIARGEHGRAIAERGLRFRTPEETTVLRLPVVARPAEVTWREGDVAFLSMKSQDTELALRELAASASPELPVVCAQNGVENERLALRLFANVHGMCVKMSATYLEAGVVCAYGTPKSGALDLGRFPHGIDAVDSAVAEALRGANCLSEADPDVMRRKYAKLVINTTNALEAAAGEGARRSVLRERVRAEAIACLRALGIEFDLPPSEEQRNAQIVSGKIDGKTYPGNSTWQSMVRGAPESEVDMLNGEIVLLGRLHGIPTPINAMLQQLMHRMLREGIAPGSLGVEELEREVAAVSGGARAT